MDVRQLFRYRIMEGLPVIGPESESASSSRARYRLM